MSRLALIVAFFVSTSSLAIMREVIDMASSSVTITHALFPVSLNGTQMTQTVGKSVHSLGMLEPRIYIRLYNRPVDLMPASILRDAYNPSPVEIDRFLVFETSYGLSQFNTSFPAP